MTDNEIISDAQLIEWLRLDPGTDALTLTMLRASAIDVVSHATGIDLRTSTDPVPASLRHAVALLVGAHYDDRSGAVEAAHKAARALAAPYWQPRL